MSSTNPFAMFQTEVKLEQQGIRVDYGAFWFQVIRVDAPNSVFAEMLRKEMQPFQRALELRELDEKIIQRITTKVFAATAVLNWGSIEHGDGIMAGQSIVVPDGEDPKTEAIPFSKDAVADMLTKLPDLFKDLLTQSRDLANFRKLAAEENAGN